MSTFDAHLIALSPSRHSYKAWSEPSDDEGFIESQAVKLTKIGYLELALRERLLPILSDKVRHQHELKCEAYIAKGLKAKRKKPRSHEELRTEFRKKNVLVEEPLVEDMYEAVIIMLADALVEMVF